MSSKLYHYPRRGARAGRLTKLTRPNGTVRELTYDAADQLTRVVERQADGTPIVVFQMTYDAAGRMQTEFSAPLQHAWTPATRTLTFSNDNCVATFNGTNVNHDKDGNLTGGGPWSAGSLGYDARNRLTSALNVSYTYGPGGERLKAAYGALTNEF